MNEIGFDSRLPHPWEEPLEASGTQAEERGVQPLNGGFRNGLLA